MARPLPQQLQLDPPPDFELVTARLRRLAGADNKTLAAVLHITPRVLENIDQGRMPDYRTGAALLTLLARIGGDTGGLTRR